MTFDIEFIKEAGYSIVTPIVVTNYSEYCDVVVTENKNLELDNKIITVIR